jgi:hypothetical protein
MTIEDRAEKAVEKTFGTQFGTHFDIERGKSIANTGCVNRRRLLNVSEILHVFLYYFANIIAAVFIW